MKGGAKKFGHHTWLQTTVVLMSWTDCLPHCIGTAKFPTRCFCTKGIQTCSVLTIFPAFNSFEMDEPRGVGPAFFAGLGSLRRSLLRERPSPMAGAGRAQFRTGSLANGQARAPAKSSSGAHECFLLPQLLKARGSSSDWRDCHGMVRRKLLTRRGSWQRVAASANWLAGERACRIVSENIL